MKLKITLEGVTYELDVEFVDEGEAAPPSGASGPAPKVPSAPAASSAPKSAPAKPAPTGSGASSSEKTIACPLSGTVWKVLVKVGDVVAANQDLLILEAMKMETNIISTMAGTIKSIAVAEGDAVSQGQLLIEFE
uniref:Methylmalonyl-CoA carboxyltransferase 1.3S subunit n=1 Tax=Candidatus Kentrum eta TaxID=2126337 RepID=A0A450VHB4_9GAMM|nr:MAG: methylmalonyl-CoA carboxyltransferase 1.3S subunit [Candidatus Kentron sp. H]VFK00269.1 MAG: methylmalonyl-CoA carboxyltransferase 1.3S subunit [Candidatus Kentron sp. H]VFK04213.1 MAG: methylmalonyl-CoA carboxyltransferase 1.3S subunit [Candidatus Kentron sp. H]